MACGGCSKRGSAERRAMDEKDLMGGYANLTDRQIKARLETYKRRYCPTCKDRYECDYDKYVDCNKNKQQN